MSTYSGRHQHLPMNAILCPRTQKAGVSSEICKLLKIREMVPRIAIAKHPRDPSGLRKGESAARKANCWDNVDRILPLLFGIRVIMPTNVKSPWLYHVETKPLTLLAAATEDPFPWQNACNLRTASFLCVSIGRQGRS